MHTAARAGWSVEVVSATAGEGSPPALTDPLSRPARASVRRAELRRGDAMPRPGGATSPASASPTARVADARGRAGAALVEAVGTGGDEVLLVRAVAPRRPPDHEAVGRAAATAAPRTDARLVEYPVWFWHWGRAGRPRRGPLARLPLDERTPRRRSGRPSTAHAARSGRSRPRPVTRCSSAPSCSRTSTRPRAVPGRRTRCDDDVPRPGPPRAARPVAGRLILRAAQARGVAGEPAAGAYRCALEVGCSVGALAVDLATRCATGCWPSTAAPRPSTSPVGVRAGLDERRGPTGPGAGRVADGALDLVSVSEVGYFLSPRRLAELVRALPRLTEPTTVTCSCATGDTSRSAGRWPDRPSTTQPSSLPVVGCWSSTRSPTSCCTCWDGPRDASRRRGRRRAGPRRGGAAARVPRRGRGRRRRARRGAPRRPHARRGRPRRVPRRLGRVVRARDGVIAVAALAGCVASPGRRGRGGRGVGGRHRQPLAVGGEHRRRHVGPADTG